MTTGPSYTLRSPSGNQNLAFPNISFRESIIGPQVQTRAWRDTIGVAGVFSKGPAEATVIEGRDAFVRIYGEDSTSGSVAVQQAMLQGASRFVISRVVPTPRAASTAIALTNSSNAFIAAQVATGSNRTTGLTLTTSYIGTPVEAIGNYLGTTVTVNKTRPTLSGFKGYGFFDFNVEETIATSGYVAKGVTGVTIVNAGSGVQEISIDPSPTANVTAFLNIKPGTVLSLAPGNATAWANATAYVVGQLVTSSGALYVCNTNHTSPSNPTAFNTSQGWTLVAAAWATGTNYVVGSLVVSSNTLYVSNAIHTSGGTFGGDSANWATPSIAVTAVSYPYLKEDGDVAVLVKGAVSAIPAGVTTLPVRVNLPSANDLHILSYTYRAVSGTLPTALNLLADRAYITGATTSATETFRGAVAYSAGTTTAQTLNLIAFATGTYSEVNSNIQIALGGGVTGYTLVPNAKFSIPVLATSVAIGDNDSGAPGFPSATALAEGAQADEVLRLLQTAIYADATMMQVYEDALVNNNDIPATLTLTTRFKGDEANRVFFALSRTQHGTATDLTYSNTGGSLYGTHQNLLGGSDGATKAKRYLYDLQGNPIAVIEAVNPGPSTIVFSVVPQGSGQFRLEVFDSTAALTAAGAVPEIYQLSNYNVNPANGLYNETADSLLIRVYFVPAIDGRASITSAVYESVPQRLAPYISTTSALTSVLHPGHRGSTYLKNIALEGGANPAAFVADTPDVDYVVEAIDRLADQDCAFIICPQAVTQDPAYLDAATALANQAKNSTVMSGLRLAVLTTPKGVSAGSAKIFADTYNSDRVIALAGYSSLATVRGTTTNPHPSLGFYVGHLAVTPPQDSPAVMPKDRSLVGVSSSEFRYNVTRLDGLTKSRTEVLYYDPGLNQYKFLNGLTTSSDPNLKYASVRRVADLIITRMHESLQWIRSQNHTPKLRAQAADAVDALMTTLVREGVIAGFRPTICDDTNNPPESVRAARLNIKATWTPLFPADFIRVDLVRDLSTEVSINTAA